MLTQFSNFNFLQHTMALDFSENGCFKHSKLDILLLLSRTDIIAIGQTHLSLSDHSSQIQPLMLIEEPLVLTGTMHNFKLMRP